MTYRLTRSCTLVSLVVCGFGCGDDPTCPDGTVLIDGVCLADDGDGGVRRDSGPECVPSGDEICDGSDQDCDGIVDEGLTTSMYFVDEDGDLFGGAEVAACGPVAGVVEVGGDCDDSNPSANPEGTEVCNEVDDDCDGSVDEALLRAGEPVSLGLEGLALADTFFPYGDGFFYAYFDGVDAAFYVLLDREGSVMAGPLRLIPTPLTSFIFVVFPLDEDRVLVIWPEFMSGFGTDVRGRILDVTTPADSSEAVTLLPNLNGSLGVAILNDHVVVVDNPFSSQPDDAPARAFSIDLDLTDTSGPVSIERTAGERLSFVGRLGATDSFLLRGFEDRGTLTPVVPATLALGTPADPTPRSLRLLDETGMGPEAVTVDDSGGQYVFRWLTSVAPDGTIVEGEIVTSELPVQETVGVFGFERLTTNRYLGMVCSDVGPDRGDCTYQFLSPAGEVSDPLSISAEGPEPGFVAPQLARNGSTLAAMVLSGDLAAESDVFEPHFIPFECPAP